MSHYLVVAVLSASDVGVVALFRLSVSFVVCMSLIICLYICIIEFLYSPVLGFVCGPHSPLLITSARPGIKTYANTTLKANGIHRPTYINYCRY